MGLEQNSGPKPSVMKLDRAVWAQELHLSNFVNSYYQYRDVQSLPNVRRLLVVGPGQGLDTAVFRWRGYEVVTFDIDATFHPDVIGSVHEMKMFAEREFDVVVASHVVEHLPVDYLDDALRELARVARFALIYLPSTGRPMALSFSPGFRGLRWSVVVDLYNWFRGPDPNRPIFAAGEHYWEVGRRGFSRRSLARRLRSHFRILKQYRNRDWLLSVNFVLESKRSGE
jgi:methyltransferase family protein